LYDGVRLDNMVAEYLCTSELADSSR